MKKISLGGKYGKNKFTLVDAEDFSKFGKLKWYVNAQGYAVHRFYKKGKRLEIERLHRLIMGLPKIPNGLYIDHINGNTLDNRKSNLRICSHAENMANMKIHTHRKGLPKTSKYKGVYFDKSRNKWAADLKFKYQRFRLGRYNTELEAAKVYNKAAKKHFKQFAKLNII